MDIELEAALEIEELRTEVEKLTAMVGPEPLKIDREQREEIQRLNAHINKLDAARTKDQVDLLLHYRKQDEELRAEVEKLRAEAVEWKERYEAERADHEATMRHCDKLMNEDEIS